MRRTARFFFFGFLALASFSTSSWAVDRIQIAHSALSASQAILKELEDGGFVAKLYGK